MKRALIVIASVGILAVTVAMESANAQYTRPYRHPPASTSPPYTPQSRGWDPRTAPSFSYTFSYTAPSSNTARFSNPDSPTATGGGSIGYNQFWKWKWW
jgi:hypothetical protein